MAVPEGPTDKRYTGNGVTKIFTIPFLLLAATDLDVYIDGIEISSGFAITNVGNPTSTITFTVAPVDQADIYLQLNVPFERLNDYQENGDFLSSTVNRDFDRIWQALKQLFRWSTRSLRLGNFDVDGAGWYRAKGNGIRDLKDPVEAQDASTKVWTQRYVGDVVGGMTGNPNLASNIFYLGPDGLPYVVQDLSNSTDFQKGASLLGRGVFAVDSVKDLLSIPRYSSQIAIVKSYFLGADLGYGLFRWIPSMPKNLHDGGKVISPTIPWNGALSTHSEFLARTGEVDPNGVGCWVRMTETTFGTHYGMTPSAASAAIQKMLMSGGRKQIPDGVFRMATPIFRDFSANDFFPETGDASLRFTLEGQSISNSILQYAGAGYAMEFTGSKNVPVGQNVHSMLQVSRLALKPADAQSRTCSGIRMINHAYTSLRDLDLEYLDTGLELKSVITCDFERVYVRSCTVGLSVNGAGFSMPNANDFRRFTAQSCTYAGVVAARIGGGFHMQGGTIEGNGAMGVPGTGGFIGNIDGVNGSATLSLTNFYFEGNKGDADLLLTNMSPYTVTVVLTNVNFNRVGDLEYTKNNISLNNTGGGKIILVLNGVSFMRGGNYVASASRPYIFHDNACEVINNGVSYRDEIEHNKSLTSSPTVSGRVQSSGAALSLPVGISSVRLSIGVYEITSTVGWGINANGYVATAVSTESAGGIKVSALRRVHLQPSV
ncbi:hypothetical protein ACIGCH_15945 [Pseudomonas helleri]|uniref:hypothetical protein n=1 Tax=Pseudomonas helleri TaxID=1608996 RepID=UPI0037C9BA2A